MSALHKFSALGGPFPRRVKDVYDYRAFGARYFDPFFGLWTSPDPAGQFANPYTYGGDPINFVDPNGEEVTVAVVVTAAIIVAVIGGPLNSGQNVRF